jgi:hypothetical protein
MRGYNVGKQTVRDLIKDKSRLITFAAVSNSAGGMSKRKSMKSSTYDESDKARVLWFSQQRTRGISVSGAICAAQAKYFFDELKLQGDFNASSGWMARFKQKHGTRQITVQGKKMSCDEPAADEYENESQKFIENEGFILEKFSMLTRPVYTGSV